MLSMSTSNNNNVYNSLGVRPLFRNIKITINGLVFSPTKKQMEPFKAPPTSNTHTHTKLMKSDFVINADFCYLTVSSKVSPTPKLSPFSSYKFKQSIQFLKCTEK